MTAPTTAAERPDAHTPEPWECERRNWRNEPSYHDWYVTGDRHATTAEDEDGNIVDDGDVATAVAVVVGNETAGVVTEANARRIVAAVNACAGVPTAALEKLNVRDALDAAGLEVAALRAGREISILEDEVAALRAAVEECWRHRPTEDGVLPLLVDRLTAAVRLARKGAATWPT